jgi:hypothetical protein
MRKLLFVAALAGIVSACSTATPPAPVATQMTAPQAMPTIQQRQEISAVRTESAVPEWFGNLPSQPNKIFAVGDGKSGSPSAALANARAEAFFSICQSAGGRVRGKTDITRTDTENSSTNVTTTAIRNFCPDVDITGATVERTHFVRDGSRFQAFVLVSLPLGEANVLSRTKQADKMQEKAVGNHTEQLKELDLFIDKNKDPVPVSSAPAQSTVTTINLLDVDNADYKQKRDEALQKPGAVIGQVTVR